MKRIQTFVFMGILGLAMGLTASVNAQSSQPGIATVVRITGEGKYSLGDNNWHPLVAGKLLPAGAVIQTGHDSSVDVVLGRKVLMPQAQPVPTGIAMAADGDVRGLISYKPAVEQNTVRLLSDTVLAIDKLTISDLGLDSVSDTELDLRQGAIYNSVKKLSGPSQYLIKIPNGIAGVRGTLFYISASGDCSVFKSSVVLSIIGSDGKPETVVVSEGDSFNPASGQAPTPMPPSVVGDLDRIFDALRTMYHPDVIFTFDRTECHISPIRP